jgi:hypothetical protein
MGPRVKEKGLRWKGERTGVGKKKRLWWKGGKEKEHVVGR